jgi:tryptophanyl-tRNA synthetase
MRTTNRKWTNRSSTQAYLPTLSCKRQIFLLIGTWFFASYLISKPIILPSATHVPVGEDQTQHLELSRDIADIFNRTFDPKKRFFPLPVQLNSLYFFI